MAIRYVDLVNGNDANNGSTFALRKKTIASAGALSTANDTIRVMKTPDATSLGSCTWSNISKSITLPSAYTANICTCETAWTASANVTCTTQSSYTRFGTYESSIAIAAGFTTGKVAYFAIGSALDLSAYQQISFFMRNSAAIPANAVYIDLCSDTTGDVPVASFLLQPKQTSYNSRLYPHTHDYGSALPASVQSIAIRAVADPGTLTLVFDNIIACKAPSDPTSITLNSIIGQNSTDEPEWYPIRYINGTEVSLLINVSWKGTAGSITTYKIEPIRIIDITPYASLPTPEGNTFTAWNIGASGSTSGYINIECGYDTTDMSTQTGYTAVDFQFQIGKGGPQDRDYINLNKFIAVRANYGLYAYNSSSFLKVGEYHSIQPAQFIYNGNLIFDKVYITSVVSGGSTTVWLDSLIGNTFSMKYLYREPTGEYYNASNSHPGAEKLSVDTMISVGYRHAFTISKARGYIKNVICFGAENSSSTNGFQLGSSDNDLKVENYTCSNTVLGYGVYSNSGSSKVSFQTFVSPIPNYSTFNAVPSQNDLFFIQNYRGTGISKGVYDTLLIENVTTPVHTAGGNAWSIQVYGNSVGFLTEPNYYKIQHYKIADIPVKANKLVTVKLWVRRVYTTSKCALFVRPEVSGISDFVVSEISAAGNTWEELTITFTPTVNSVVPVFIGTQYDAVNASQRFYFDDLSVTIAD